MGCAFGISDELITRKEFDGALEAANVDYLSKLDGWLQQHASRPGRDRDAAKNDAVPLQPSGECEVFPAAFRNSAARLTLRNRNASPPRTPALGAISTSVAPNPGAL